MTTLTFRVDMNSLRGDQIGTLLRHATDPIWATMFPPNPGDVVEVVDEDGITYQAVVDETTDKWLGLTIMWQSKRVVSTLDYRQSVSTEFTDASEWVTTAA